MRAIISQLNLLLSQLSIEEARSTKWLHYKAPLNYAILMLIYKLLRECTYVLDMTHNALHMYLDQFEPLKTVSLVLYNRKED